MKKIFVFALVIYSICQYFSMVLYCDVPMYDIFTPRGTLVETLLNDEQPDFRQRIMDDAWGLSFPGVELIILYDGVSSTRKFNCHGYAWLRVEEGIDRWMNRPSDEYYTDIINGMQGVNGDGSYVEVPNATYPGKISWGMGDHSAITTAEPGWVISKWNSGPLCRHQRGQGKNPFDDTTAYPVNVRYYVKNCAALPNSYTNDTVTTNKTKYGNNFHIQNVNVNAGKLIINDCNEVNINADFEVESGAEFEIFINP